MTDVADIRAYFARIGYAGSGAPTLDTLRALHLAHPQAIPFENLDPLLRTPVRLDVESLQRKLVRARRGGFCYEHNLLLMAVLRQLGFPVRGLAARVLWGHAEDAITPRSHMLLLVELDGAPWIADAGFGVQTLTAPIELRADIEQATPHGLFRLGRLDDGFKLQARIDGEWKTLYRFDLQAQYLPDYEVSSWHLTHHPSSPFLSSLIVARAAAQGRHALRNNSLAWHPLSGPTERRTLSSAAELRSALEDVFAVELPVAPEVDRTLERFAANG